MYIVHGWQRKCMFDISVVQNLFFKWIEGSSITSFCWWQNKGLSKVQIRKYLCLKKHFYCINSVGLAILKAVKTFFRLVWFLEISAAKDRKMLFPFFLKRQMWTTLTVLLIKMWKFWKSLLIAIIHVSKSWLHAKFH